MIPPRIGLLGGSFNPAHAGHLHITREALKRLQLDEVWWLVSPQNPLKPTEGMAPYAERFASALAVTRGHKHIRVSDFEARGGYTYTHATLQALKRRYPRITFVWIMGADNLHGFHRWQRWHKIANLVAVAIFDRAPFSHKALRTRAAIALKNRRMRDSQVAKLWCHTGKWAYVLMRRHPASSTEIRRRRSKTKP